MSKKTKYHIFAEGDDTSLRIDYTGNLNFAIFVFSDLISSMLYDHKINGLFDISKDTFNSMIREKLQEKFTSMTKEMFNIIDSAINEYVDREVEKEDSEDEEDDDLPL